VAGKLKQCAAVLAQHLDDSEARLLGVMAGRDSLNEAARARPRVRDKKATKSKPANGTGAGD